MRTFTFAALLVCGFTAANTASAETFSVWGQNFNSTVTQSAPSVAVSQPQNFVAEAPDAAPIGKSHQKHHAKTTAAM
jgi:hypothetical protein